MNTLFHFFFAYFLVDSFFEVNQTILVLTLVFSVVIDLDHIPYVLSHLKNVIKLDILSHGSKLRTRFHELYGVSTFAIISCIVYFFNEVYAQVIALSFLSHYLVDFVIGYTRPLFPYSNKEVFTYFVNNKSRLILEIGLTVILGVYFFVA